jgi:hypothetical protein
MQTAFVPMVLPVHPAPFTSFNELGTLSFLYSNRRTPLINTTLSSDSFLSNLQQYDYSDSYLTTFKDKSGNMQPFDLINASAATMPFYLNFLKHSYRILFSSKRQKSEYECGIASRIDEQSGVAASRYYDILFHSNSELVLGKTGNHLSIYHSVLLQNPRKNSTQVNVTFSTAVTSHTAFGKIFLIIVRPIIKNLMPVILKRAIQGL